MPPVLSPPGNRAGCSHSYSISSRGRGGLWPGGTGQVPRSWWGCIIMRSKGLMTNIFAFLILRLCIHIQFIVHFLIYIISQTFLSGSQLYLKYRFHSGRLHSALLFFCFVAFPFSIRHYLQKYQHLCREFSDIGAVLTADNVIAFIHFLNYDPHQRTDSYPLPQC